MTSGVLRSVVADRARSSFGSRLNALYLLAAIVGVVGGASIAKDQQLSSPTMSGAVLLCLLLSAYLAITLSIKPELLFTSWLFAAPLFQESVARTSMAKDLGRVIYVLPPLVLALALLLRGFARPVRAVDFLPALYFAYVLVSAKHLQGAYLTVGIGIILYYFVAFGPTTPRLGERLAAALIGSGLVVAAMAIFERLTGWNLWHDFFWRGHGIFRAVATLANPAVLGTFLGMVLAFAIAITLWNGPHRLAKLSKVYIAVSLPALYFTYTRAPIIAAAAAGILMVILATRARWPSLVLLVAAALAVFVLWGSFKSSSVYQARFGNTHNIQTRLVLQRASFTLASQRPIFGWGYGSFNVVKNNANLQTEDPAALAYNTSHNTFLTVLVELGVVGLALFLVPWVVIGRRAISAARVDPDQRWLFAGVVAAVAIYFLSASTYDARFFSFVPALPWILLGVARRVLGEEETQPA